MTDLRQRLASVLAEVMTVLSEDDEALTVAHEGTVASLRVLTIAEDLELVSLTQPLAWDLPLTNKTRERVTAHAGRTMLGSVVLVEKLVEAPVNGSSTTSAKRRSSVKKVADVLLRYNFPAAGLTDDALRTLVLLVLSAGIDVRADLTA
ncbi:hypothetical protein [Mycolicibacterium sediminis]|uniref:Uncharacterized protein n=1 Tax=Mycolicibacterium sediminis TaxID=1286180 RepID=A0A7I7QXR5_9MYCO|nr:hypothetical protein [Mycolicibacterium sediminis]BBY30706.1 hypothetical protein MSEDJ_48020 [Mycolicibacterium sediminis]